MSRRASAAALALLLGAACSPSTGPNRRPRLREAGTLPWASPGDEPPPLAVDAEGRAAGLLFHRDASLFFRWGGSETATVRLPGRPVALHAGGANFFAVIEASPRQRAIVRIDPAGEYVRLGEPGNWTEVRPVGDGLVAMRDGREVHVFDSAGAARVVHRAAEGSSTRLWLLIPGARRRAREIEIALFRPEDGGVEVVSDGASREVGRLILGSGPPVWHDGRLYWIGPHGRADRGGAALYRWTNGRSDTFLAPWDVGPLASTAEGLLAFRKDARGWSGDFLTETGAVKRSFLLPAPWRPRIVGSVAGNPPLVFLTAERRVPYLLLIATQKEDGGVLAELGNPHVRRVALAPDGSAYYLSTRRGIERVEIR